ncbi:MAG: hypothetical protein IKU15_04245 [Clostridia bacterium]|nr:hypothetical protein [Clostridia bacterium]
MCGICNVVRCISGRCGNNSNCAERRVRRCEPRMNIHCASGLGTSSETVCGMEGYEGCCERQRRCCGREHERERDCYGEYESRESCCERRRRNNLCCLDN